MTKPQDSFTFSVDEKTPAQAAMLPLINAHFVLKERLKKVIPGTAEYEAITLEIVTSAQKLEDAQGVFSEHSGHSNHHWATLTMRSVVSSTLGNVSKAIDCELEALEVAADDDQKSKNANNLCEYHRDLGLLEEALHWGHAAVLWSECRNAGAILNYAQVLHASGEKEQAERLIVELRKRSRLGIRGDVLTFHIKHEPYFAQMTDLPIVRKLRAELSNTSEIE